MKKFVMATTLGTAALVANAPSTHAADETAAVYVQGMGGSLSNNAGQSAGGLGFQAGAQLLFLEVYGSQTVFTGDSTISRAVIGPYLDFNIGSWELSLHAGVGGIRGTGGALLGNDFSGTQQGGVARLGATFEHDLGPFFVLGVSLDGESFAVKPPDSPVDDKWKTGSSVFLSGHLKFELGI